MVCGFCSTGCGLTIHLRDGKAVNLTPATEHPVKLGMACSKGWEALSVLDADDRATMPVRPKTDLVLLYALANRLIENGWIDRPLIEAHTNGFGEFAAFVEQFDVERAAAETGLSAGSILDMAADPRAVSRLLLVDDGRQPESSGGQDGEGNQGYEIVTFCEAPRPAYDRVNLTKFFERRNAGDLQLAHEEWYAENGITLYVGDRANAVDRGRRLVTSRQGREVAYDAVVLATGSAPFVPSVPGVDKKGDPGRSAGDPESRMPTAQENVFTRLGAVPWRRGLPGPRLSSEGRDGRVIRRAAA